MIISHCRIFIPSFALLFCAGNLGAQVLVEEHLDITFSYSTSDEEWRVLIRSGDFDNPDNLLSLDEATLPVQDTPVPLGNRDVQPLSSNFDFTGVPDGDPIWKLPQSSSRYNYTWPGFRNEHEPSIFRAYDPQDPRFTTSEPVQSWIALEYAGMAYAGTSSDPQFSLWQFFSEGGLKKWIATYDGVDATDRFYLRENTHTHMNWGFSSLGVYRIAFRPSAILDSTGETVVGTPQYISFAVGTKATWLASYYGGDDLVTDSVSGDESDTDSDGVELLLEYAFNMNPVLPDFAVIEEASGTSGLPSITLIPDGDEHVLQIEYIRRKSGTNPQIDYYPEFRNALDAGDWSAGGAELVTSIDAEWERVVVNDTVNTSGPSSRFGRVRIEMQETITY